jgi:exonuclease VII large subunit
VLRAERLVEGLHAQVRAHDPAHALARGWTITTTVDGRPVPRVADLAPGTSLVTRFADGTATSTVTEVDPHPTTVPPEEPAP